MAYEIDPQDLSALLMGGCFFGSGGGGTVLSAQSLLSHFKAGDYYPTDRVQVVSVDEATQGDAVMVAYLGAPQAIDGATYPIGPVQAVQQVQAHLRAQGRNLAYIAPPESGALGFTVAALVAARLGLAVLDGDGAGRAVPSLPQLTYATAEINPRPAFLVSQGGLCVELDVKPRSGVDGDASHQQDVSAIIDQMMRPIVAQANFGEFGGLAMWVMRPSQLERALPVQGTLSRALAVGRAVQGGQLDTTSRLIAFLQQECGLAARVLFGPGELVAGTSGTGGGFDTGQMKIQAGTDTCTVAFQNESLLAWSSAQTGPLGMAPDSIAYFVEGTGQSVFSNGDLLMADGSLNPVVKQRRFSVIGIPAVQQLRRDELILSSFEDLLAGVGYHGGDEPLAAQHGGTQ